MDADLHPDAGWRLEWCEWEFDYFRRACAADGNTLRTTLSYVTIWWRRIAVAERGDGLTLPCPCTLDVRPHEIAARVYRVGRWRWAIARRHGPSVIADPAWGDPTRWGHERALRYARRWVAREYERRRPAEPWVPLRGPMLVPDPRGGPGCIRDL